MIGGKDFVSELSGFLQREKGFSITINMLIDGISAEEIDEDLRTIITSLDTFRSSTTSGILTSTKAEVGA